jgi:hemolysin activation/secretion protein
MRGRQTALCAILVAGLSTPTFAQDIPAGAEPGRIDTRFDQPVAPTVKPRVVSGLESTTPPAEAAALKLKIASVSITGSSVYSAQQLSALSEEIVGQTVSLEKVFEIAAAVTARYGKDGYILSRAIVPPQELDPDGAHITISVIEGYVDEVKWPDFVSKYKGFFSDYAAKVSADRPLNVRTLERYLLLANDLPGLSFESNLVASESNAGASTLVITGKEDGFDGYVSADNYGVEASGPYQATLGGSLNNQLGYNERFDFGVTLAGPSEDGRSELSYLSWGYEQIFTSEGLTFFLDGNASWGRPGTTSLLAFDSKTSGVNVSAGIRYPFIRTRSENLTGTLAFDFKNSESSNLGIPATEDRLRIIRGELAYDFADEHNGVNRLVGTASLGIEGLGSTANNNPLASRSPGDVDFFKLTAEASRTQKFGDRFSAYGSVFGQWSADPLLSSQECGYGGRSYGRGLDASIITGDQCLLASLELRRDLDVSDTFSGIISYAQPYAFVDYGHIWNIDAPLGTAKADDAASAGLGIRFGSERFSADLSLSQVVLTPESQPDTQQTRGWFKTTLKF